MATRSSLLAWRISWTEEPGGLRRVGLKRLSTHARAFVTKQILVFHIDYSSPLPVRDIRDLS